MNDYEHLIIRKPEGQPRMLRVLWRLVTVFFWLLYAYMLAPVATVLWWLVGLRTGYSELYQPGEGIDPFLLVQLPLIALGCVLVVVVWAGYNRRRFRGNERRTRHPLVGAEQVALALQAPAGVRETLEGNRVVVLHMDDQARPVSASPLALLPPAA